MKNTTCFLLLLAVTATLIIAGCAQQQQQVQASSTPAAVRTADTIRVTSSTLGTILTDGKGNTLYYFANDVPASGASTCTAQCAIVWPAFSAGTLQVSAPLDTADFGTITRADGTQQTTWHGWPLYYYATDSAPGDVNGENVQKVWFVVKTGENVLITHSPDLGLYLTDISGKTLYIFTKDTAGTSACTGTCLAKWPAFYANPVSAPSVLNLTDFSVVSRADGVNQTAYMGRSLYSFTGDAKPGDVNGQGFNNAWYVANVSVMTPVATTQPTAASTTNSASAGYGGGY
jgi:predicted lipoprotein with Yx(FWY)xxD motif